MVFAFVVESFARRLSFAVFADDIAGLLFTFPYRRVCWFFAGGPPRCRGSSLIHTLQSGVRVQVHVVEQRDAER